MYDIMEVTFEILLKDVFLTNCNVVSFKKYIQCLSWTRSYYSLLNTKRHSMYMFLGPCAQRTFWLLSHTPLIPINVLSRT